MNTTSKEFAKLMERLSKIHEFLDEASSSIINSEESIDSLNDFGDKMPELFVVSDDEMQSVQEELSNCEAKLKAMIERCLEEAEKTKNVVKELQGE